MTRPVPVAPGLALALISVPHGIERTHGLGVRYFGGTDEVGPDTIFPLASLSKPISSTIMAAVIDYNSTRLSWDNEITGLGSYRELFAHRTGLPDHTADVLEDFGCTRQQIPPRLVRFPRNPIRPYA